jgi:hypothetical protein
MKKRHFGVFIYKKRCHFGDFFHKRSGKNAISAFFHKIVLKNAVSAIFFIKEVKKMPFRYFSTILACLFIKKDAETAFFHKIL